MSLYGAMRLYIHARTTSEAAGRSVEPDVDAQPVRPGAWAEWAREQEAGMADERTGAACVTPDGRIGRLVHRFDGARWVEECEIA
jgi:hypothetical protein